MADTTIAWSNDPGPWPFIITRPPSKRARVWFSRAYGRTKHAACCRLADLLGEDGGALLTRLDGTGGIHTRWWRIPNAGKLLDALLNGKLFVKIADWPWCRATEWTTGLVEDGSWVDISLKVERA